MGPRSRADKLDSELLEAMSELITGLIAKGEQIAQRLGVPGFCLKALHVLDDSMAMRDLGRYLHCDPSFVTAIADLMEKHGLASRQPSTVDRRIKNLVLTEQGIALRQKAEREFLAHMPWRVLDTGERTCLLALIRKMIRADSEMTPEATPGAASVRTPSATAGAQPGEVSQTLVTPRPAG